MPVRNVVLVLLAALAWLPPAQAQDVYTPRRGSAERVAILDAVRAAVETRLYSPVEFVVERMDVTRGWAFVALEPQRPGGVPIDVAATRLAADAPYMDGLTTYALVRYAYGRWNLIAWVIGPTDVAWADWGERYGAPPEILRY